MLLSLLFYRALRFLLPLAVLATIYLYLYPLFHGCVFPEPTFSSPADAARSLSGNATKAHINVQQATVAPFRLLAFGDPQLEGDTSLPDTEDARFPGLEDLRTDFKHVLKKIATEDLPRLLQYCRKCVDLWGNDYYLAHIYRTLHWWTRPTHVTVLGDLLGSQWIEDEEFESRSERFWQRVFRRGSKVAEAIMDAEPGRVVKVLGEERTWNRRIINVAGNHDIGYAGDINSERVERWEKAFGKVNWDVRLQLPLNTRNDEVSSPANSTASPELRLVILNDMNLDTPAWDTHLQAQTYAFINNVISSSRPVEDRTTFTILLTHIPLPKEGGVCVDGPFFDYHEGYRGGGVREQNHLSETAAMGILEGMYGTSGDASAPAKGRGRNGVILTGHDHEGCDVYHYNAQDGSGWKAERWAMTRTQTVAGDSERVGIREITVRSMMGQFGGNAGLLSAWFDPQLGEWRFEFANCALGVQHIWWAVHVLDLVVVLLAAVALAASIVEARTGSRDRSRKVEAAVDGEVEQRVVAGDGDACTTWKHSKTGSSGNGNMHSSGVGLGTSRKRSQRQED
ncbi:hypothetical protein BJ546DRAFT_377045 [Cryomyces antarcticus]